MPEAICAWIDVQEAGDHFRDICNAAGDFINGAWNAAKDLVTGLVGLVWGLTELMLYDKYSDFPLNLVPVPEWLDADIQNMQDTFEQVIKDPGNVLESMGQSMFDTADEKGIAYSSGYVVADVVIAILTDKGLDKLKDVGDAGKVLESRKYSLPQGISQEQFSSASKLLRDKEGNISDDFVVQGSRASGTAKATSDIDIALRLQLQDIFEIDVDISVIKIGGSFDNLPFIPFE